MSESDSGYGGLPAPLAEGTAAAFRSARPQRERPDPAAWLGELVRFIIRSDFAETTEVQQSILQEAAGKGYNADALFAIKLSLEEALINAIKHGNCGDPAKHVYIEANITAAQAEIIVEDEGCGFDRQAVPDPRLEENLCKCSGRGILLIESYMSSVQWSHGGRRVRMIKRNEQA